MYNGEEGYEAKPRAGSDAPCARLAAPVFCFRRVCNVWTEAIVIPSLRRSLALATFFSVGLLAFVVGRGLGALVRSPFEPHVESFTLNASRDSAYGGGGGGYVSDVPPQDIFEDVLDHVQRDFVEPTGGPKHLSEGALARMIAALDDPKTSFLDTPRLEARRAALGGRYYGIGATLGVTRTKKEDVEYRHLTVVDVAPGSPAEKAGLRSGDYLTEMDGHWIIAYSILADANRIRKEANKDDAAREAELKPISDRFEKGYSIEKALDHLLVGEGKTYRITVERAGQPAPLSVTCTTALTQLEPVTYTVLNGSVGYLRVRQFNPRATQQFEAALEHLNGAKSLIVDLQQNPGGVTAEAKTGVDGYNSAMKLLAKLTHGGPVATLEKKPNQKQPITILPEQPVKLPLVVLVDGGTSNLAEMVAAALHDVAKAKIIGSRTFGDDVLQLFAPLKNNTGLEIATGHLLTVDGVDIRRGVTPDIVVKGDGALRRALAELGV